MLFTYKVLGKYADIVCMNTRPKPKQTKVVQMPISKDRIDALIKAGFIVMIVGTSK